MQADLQGPRRVTGRPSTAGTPKVIAAPETPSRLKHVISMVTCHYR